MRKFSQLTMLLSLSIILSLIESFIPFFNGIVPGLKIGLANIITLFVLYLYGIKDAFKISILRVFIVGILRSTGVSFIFSLTGAIFSILSMSLFKHTKLSIIGVSIIGAVFHSGGQIIAAAIILKNIKVTYYFPYLILFSIVTGLAIGYISKESVKRYKNKLNY